MNLFFKLHGLFKYIHKPSKFLKTIIRLFLTRLIGKDFDKIKRSGIENTNLISFDVFDTLIIRPGIEQPSDVFDMLHPEDSSFKAKRIAAEWAAREKGYNEGKEDIHIWEIYQTLYPDDKITAAAGEKIEFNTELTVCKVNPEALEFFNSIRAGIFGKKKIVIISNMYLEREQIEKILIKCGYDLIEVPVYVSSEYGKSKISGSLFSEVLKNENIRASEMLHIGDNLKTDYIVPRKLGIKSILYRRQTHIGT